MSSVRSTVGGALAVALGVTAALGSFAAPAKAQAPANDYPTNARADYVYACMKVNGETREVLDKCACSVDLIATILPYDKYEEAETFMSMGQMLGENGAFYRNSPTSKVAVGDLKRAQAEAEMRCF